MWSWNHIKEHRTMKHKYREAYIKKLESKKIPGDLQKELEVRYHSCRNQSEPHVPYVFNVNGYTFRGSNSVSAFISLFVEVDS